MRLPAVIRQQIIAHALEVRPIEACGLLAVDADGEVQHAYPIRNVDGSRTSFTLDPDGHYAALVDAESRGWEIGGVFHSHPFGPAVPSSVDVASEVEPGWLHLIVGLADPNGPELRAWRISGGAPTEMIIDVEA